MRLPRMLLIAILAALPLAAARAQGPFATVIGVVRDTAGRGIEGADVSLGKPPLHASTDAAGRFRLDLVPLGDRRLLVRRIGYAPMHPLVKVPQLRGDTLVITMIPAPQQLDPVVVESDRPGIRGVVGDTGFHAIPGTLIELLGSGRADTTDERGQWGFDGLKDGSYMLRIIHPAFHTRLFSVFVSRGGQEYSVILDRLGEGKGDWRTTHQAIQALDDLGHRLAWQASRYRLTRKELVRFGSGRLCDIPQLHGEVGEFPLILQDGMLKKPGESLCDWNADEVELIEWGREPCAEVTGSIALAYQIYCGAKHQASFGNTGGTMHPRGGPWVVIWLRS